MVHGKNANSFVGVAGLAAYCGSTLSRLFTALRLPLCRRTEFFLHHVDTLSRIRHGKCHVADIFAARGPARPHSSRGDGQAAPRAAALEDLTLHLLGTDQTNDFYELIVERLDDQHLQPGASRNVDHDGGPEA